MNYDDVTDEKMNEKFSSFTSYTDDDVKKVLDNEDYIETLSMKDGLAKFADDIKLLVQMVKDIFAKRYTSLPFASIAAIVGTLLYILSPIDMIPDFIPVVGLIDDVGILMMCLGAMKIDIERYKEWLYNNGDAPLPELLR